jgi:hypothetical protein
VEAEKGEEDAEDEEDPEEEEEVPGIPTEEELQALRHFKMVLMNLALEDDAFSRVGKKVSAADLTLAVMSPQKSLEVALVFQEMVVLVEAEIKGGDAAEWASEVKELKEPFAKLQLLLPKLLERASKAVQHSNEVQLSDTSEPSAVLSKMIATFPTLKALFEALKVPKVTDPDLLCMGPFLPLPSSG